jgi:hypothetical protein
LKPVRGANESTQYNAVVGHESLLESRVEPIGVNPVNGCLWSTLDRLGQLRGQLEGELQPVLRKQDSDQFDLERATATVRTVAQQLGPG